MHIVFAILGCILLGYFRMWLVQHLFIKEKKLFSRKLFGTSVLLVGGLYGFSYIMQGLFPHLETLSLPWFGYFLLYVALISIFLTLLSSKHQTKQIWFLLLVWLVMFAIVGGFGIKIGLQSVVLFYLVSAYAEEFLKIGATETSITTNFYSSDLLFFSLFIGLGFSIAENVLYIIQSLRGGAETGIFSLVVGRGVFSSILHLVTTGLVALLLYKRYQHITLKGITILKKAVRVAICLLAGVLVHLGYNIASEYAQVWVYIVLVIGGYFLLTYLLFLSDQLYKNP